MLKAGIAGLGFMGRMHLENYLKRKDVEVIAVSDTRRERLSGNLAGGGNIPTEQDKFDFSGMKTYEEASDLVEDKNLDVVILTLPTYLHAQLTVKALEAGKHVFCEKPMARNLKECDSMISAARKSGKKLMIGQCLRFWPEYEVLEEYVNNRKFGKLVSLFCFRGGGTPVWSGNNWILQKEKAGGALLDQHIHDIDTVNFLLGLPDSVFASGKNVVKGSGIDIVSTNYIYPQGPVVNALDNWVLNGEFGFNMTYLAAFERGNIAYDANNTPTIKINPDQGESFIPQLAPGDGYSREIDYFLKSIIEDKPLERVSPESARDSVKIALAEMRSIEEDRPVKLEECPAFTEEF